MALWRSKGARKDATRGTQPVEVRRADALLFANTGVIPGSVSGALVTGTSSMAYQVGAAGFVSSRSDADGFHVFGNDGPATTPTVGAAPGSGLSRIDVIWVRHPAAGDNSDTTSEPEFGVTSGTPAASPTAPAIPTGALELARNTMSAGATTTSSSGNSIAQTYKTAWLRGSVLVTKIDAPAGTIANTTTGSAVGVSGQTIALPACDYTRIVEFKFGLLLTSLTASYADVSLRQGSTAIRTVRLNSSNDSATGSVSVELPATSATTSFQLVFSVSGTGSGTSTPNNLFTFLSAVVTEQH